MKITSYITSTLLFSLPILLSHSIYAEPAQLEVPKGDVVMSYSEFESVPYSDVMSGLVELTPTLDISYKANIECLINNQYNQTDDTQEMNVEFSKRDYDTLLEEADKEAEIAAMETGFFYPSYNSSLHGQTSDSKQQRTSDKQERIDHINLMFKNMMTSVMSFQHKDSQCKVNNFEAHLITKTTRS